MSTVWSDTNRYVQSGYSGKTIFPRKENYTNLFLYEEDLCKAAHTTVNDLCEQMGTTPVQIVYHRDESTPHFHYFFRNFDDNGSSICFNNRTRDKLSVLQDIVHRGFAKFGFDRGIKKDKEDLGVYDYTTTKKWKATQLDNLQKNISQLKFDLMTNEPKLKNVYNELNKSKNEFD